VFLLYYRTKLIKYSNNRSFGWHSPNATYTCSTSTESLQTILLSSKSKSKGLLAQLKQKCNTTQLTQRTVKVPIAQVIEESHAICHNCRLGFSTWRSHTSRALKFSFEDFLVFMR